MNPEWLMIALMGVGGVGFAVGGTGPKQVRRYVMPFLFGLVAFFGGIVWWKALVYALAQSLVLHLGYGERVGYFRKTATSIFYILPSLILGFTYWQIITPVSFLLMFKLSNTRFTANIFVWKLVEFFYGTLLGATIAHIIQQ